MTASGSNTGLFLPISFLFYATGGNNVYSWSDQQVIGTYGFIQATNGSGTAASGPTQESLVNNATDPTGPAAAFFDAPGLGNTTNYGPVVNAFVVWTATLSVTVSSGGQTVNCPTVQWQAIEFWRNGAPVLYWRGLMAGVSQ
jgi:hypothetical protein